MTRKALVVGISTYTHLPRLNLETFSNNAEAIAQKLQHDCNFEVTRLPAIKGNKSEPIVVGQRTPVTKAELEQAIVELFQPQGNFPPTTALLYFAGHGKPKTEGFSGGYLVTSDADFEQNWGLSLAELRNLLQASNITEQIIWLDSCYSSELLNLQEANPGDRNNGSRCFITAATNLAYADNQGNYGVFTQALLKGLNPANYLSGEINNLSLSAFIRQELEKSKFPQTPVFSNFGTAIQLIEASQSNNTSLPTEIPIICPYQGLEYFTESAHAYFFGRTQLTSQLLSRVDQSNFLAILGASGSGKSSLLRAGLLYELKQGQRLSGSESWQYYLMQPGEKPLQNLALVFVNPNLSNVERAKEIEQAEEQINKGADGLKRLVQAHDAERVVLLIDQFEEVFTLCQGKSEREQFFQCLLEAIAITENKLCVIIAMRADFFGKCVEAEYSGLGQTIQANLVSVTPMREEELELAITEPAKRVKLNLEPEIVTEVIKDVQNAPGSLPLMQDTLRELWRNDIEQEQNNCLRLKTYIKLGRVAGTLQQRATQVYEQFSPEQQEIARHIFLSLTQLGEGTEDTRRRVLKQDLVISRYANRLTLIDEVIQTLADNKLIVTRNQATTNNELRQESVVDVAHEALIRNWDNLREWLDESRNYLLKKREIETVALKWRKQEYKSDYLLRGTRLTEANTFQKKQKEEYSLSKLAVDFIAKSIKDQRNESIKSFGLFLITLPILISTTGYFVVRQIELNFAQKLIQQCEETEFCLGRKEALEILAKARRSLKYYNLSSLNFSEANFLHANFSNTNFSKSKFYLAKLKYANFSGADLSGTDFSMATLTGADLSNADISSARFNLTILNLVDFSMSNLSNTSFSDTFLSGANLSGTNLFRADLLRTKLSHTTLYHAYLIDVKNLTFSQIKSACHWEKAFYKGHFDEKENKWIVDEKANQQYIKRIKQDKNSDPKKPVDCSFWK